MIMYGEPNPKTGVIPVTLSGKLVGSIKKVDSGYQYFPKGHKTGGKVFPTVIQVQMSLEI
jgi:hypothetical protein